MEELKFAKPTRIGGTVTISNMGACPNVSFQIKPDDTDEMVQLRVNLALAELSNEIRKWEEGREAY